MRLHYAHILSTLLLSATVATAQTYTLQNRFQEGETLYLHMDIEMRGAEVTGDQQNPILARRDTLLVLETESVSEDASATIAVEVERMLMSVPTMGMRDPIDLTEHLLRNADTRFSVEVNAQGTLTRSNADDALATSGIRGMNQSPMEYFPYLKLPEEPVRKNQSWNHSWEVPYANASKPVIAYATYTLDDLETGNDGLIAIIRSETRIAVDNIRFGSVPGQSAIQMDLEYSRYRVSSEGRIRFDLEQGRMVSFEDDKHMEMDMNTETLLAGAELPATMQLILRQITTGTCSPERPEPVLSVTPGNAP